MISDIAEALPLSTAKKYTKGWDKERVKAWFDGKYRAYMPLEEVDSIDQSADQNVDKLNREMAMSADISVALKNKGYKDPDIDKGTILDKYDRPVKIGKALKYVDADLAKEYEDFRNQYFKSFKIEPMVVISRHPYDIAGQSTDRGWTSCKNLKGGCYSNHVKAEAKQNLIAYLINPDDKNINHPVARLLLVPYMDENLKPIFVPENKIYGEAGKYEKAFKATVKKWLDDKQGELEGKFKASPYAYLDTLPDEIELHKPGKYPDWLQNAKIKDADIKINSKTLLVTWVDGIWEFGVWENGVWENGIWKDGVWRAGTWEKGGWRGGLWESGVWKGGLWERGTWKKGKIYDPDKNGNFKPDWEWEGNYVHSPISPKEYFAGKQEALNQKTSDLIERAIDKVLKSSSK